jgi:N-acylglucosamine-6-phosphate 2-epimerase
MKTAVFESLRGRLIVSCQAYPGEPLRDPGTMARVAQSAVIGGAAAIRAQGLDDIALISRSVDVPLIGLVKVGSVGVFITPTRVSALAVAAAGAGIVALDATRRPRPGGESLKDIVAAVHGETGALVLGDVGSIEDAEHAVAAGVDAVATTLAGYTEDRPSDGGPDIALVAELVGILGVPVIAEGRIHTPLEARRAMDAGAHAVIVGTAITHPASITSWFREALES